MFGFQNVVNAANLIADDFRGREPGTGLSSTSRISLASFGPLRESPWKPLGFDGEARLHSTVAAPSKPV